MSSNHQKRCLARIIRELEALAEAQEQEAAQPHEAVEEEGGVTAKPPTSSEWDCLAWLTGRLAKLRGAGKADEDIAIESDGARLVVTVRGEFEGEWALVASTPDGPQIRESWAAPIEPAGAKADA